MTEEEVQALCDQFGIGELGKRADTISLWRLSRGNPTIDQVMEQIQGVLRQRGMNTQENLAKIEGVIRQYTVTVKPGRAGLWGEDQE